MMMAHYLWRETGAGDAADESTWLLARRQAMADQSALMQAIWRSLPNNEKRLARALATTSLPVF